MSTLKKIGFLIAFIMPALLVGGHYLGGGWHYSAFLFAYGFIPIIDFLIGRDQKNLSAEAIPKLENAIYFEAVLYALVWLQFSLLFWATYVIATSELSAFEWMGLLLSFMTIGSNGINIAHELGHKSSKFAQWHSQFALMLTCYMHFFIEHNKGHHVHVGTPLDPATSRKGQTFYRFWAQSVFGSWRSAWNLEKTRLQRTGKTMWSRHNHMLYYIALPSILCLALTAVGFGFSGEWLWEIPTFFFLQSFLSFSSLEAVNYIEHYGMQRQLMPNGRYERVNPLHSWNSSHAVSNLLLFHLQRHSDHHAFAARPYQILRHFDESPQLPSGYPTMIIMALIPPLWFKVMDAKLQEWEAKGYQASDIQLH